MIRIHFCKNCGNAYKFVGASVGSHWCDCGGDAGPYVRFSDEEYEAWLPEINRLGFVGWVHEYITSGKIRCDGSWWVSHKMLSAIQARLI